MLEYWIQIIEYFFPFLKGFIDEFLEKERMKLHRELNSPISSSKSFFSLLWDILLISMIFYFIISIINSSVKNYLIKEKQKSLRTKYKE